jgi:geranylgeranyl diphosphate synthase type II
MLYSLEAGGKRLRPALVYGAILSLGKDMAMGDAAAAAIEMIHTYSLIHDDLPCMDDDDLRRGRPTCHVRFGEAQAVLAGDGLLTEAFSVLSHRRVEDLWSPRTAVRVIQELAVGAGMWGMVGGQAMDLIAEGKPTAQQHLEAIHRCKTGALIRAAVRMGAFIGQANDEQLANLTSYAEALGLAFQVADDVLDETGDSQTLGKTAGKDLASQKATYPALLGLERARAYAQDTAKKAVDALRGFGSAAEELRDLARFTVTRQN